MLAGRSSIAGVIAPAASGLALLLGAWIVFQNWTRKPMEFGVPFVGAVLLVAGLAGFDATRSFALVGALLDPSVLGLPVLAWTMWKEWTRTTRHAFSVESAGRRLEVRLHGDGSCTTRVLWDANCLSLVGSWQQVPSGFLVTACHQWSFVLRGDAKEVVVAEQRTPTTAALQGFDGLTLRSC